MLTKQSNSSSSSMSNLAHFDGVSPSSSLQKRRKTFEVSPLHFFSSSSTTSSVVSSSVGSSSPSPPFVHHSNIRSYFVQQKQLKPSSSSSNRLTASTTSNTKFEWAKERIYWHFQDFYWLFCIRASSALGISTMEDWEAVIGVLIYASVAFFIFIGLLQLPSYTIFTIQRLSYYLTGVENAQ